jgi:hypothetical protein
VKTGHPAFNAEMRDTLRLTHLGNRQHVVRRCSVLTEGSEVIGTSPVEFFDGLPVVEIGGKVPLIILELA